MKPKIKKMNKFVRFITLGNAIGISLAPFGIYIAKKYFYRQENQNVKFLINHEMIHWKQQLEMWILPFYIWYVFEWIIRIFTDFDRAYKAISFEQEAKKYERNLNYLKKRKRFAWLKFLDS